MRITYFANDLSDAAVSRRVELLQLGGAELNVVGFRRTAKPIERVAGLSAIDLGQTHDARLYDRALKVIKTSFDARHWKNVVKNSDVFLARNLDMAFIASAAQIWSTSNARLAYECLDIHGSLLGSDMPSRILRALDKRLVRGSSALLVSSPAFVEHYFGRLGISLPAVIIAENKRLPDPNEPERPQPDRREHGPPWKIGWFGNLRCKQSFEILCELAGRHPRLIDVELQGRPTEDLYGLIDRHLPLPNMRFKGPYTQSDLALLYGSRDLTWAIDTFQRGQNSNWLLPNRIYEGGFFNCPPIAQDGTETAKWLKARGAGIILGDLKADLETFVTGLTSARYGALKQASEAVPTQDLVYSVAECRRIIDLLYGQSNGIQEEARVLA